MLGEMTWWLLIATVLCAWAMLRVIGGERERRTAELTARIQNEADASADAAPAATEHPASHTSPVRSKAGR